MDCVYFFRLLKPSNKISVIIDLNDREGKILYASQDGTKSDLNNKNLIKSYLKHPLMTFKIILAIHFEAFKLWTKGIKFLKKKIYSPPTKKTNIIRLILNAGVFSKKKN